MYVFLEVEISGVNIGRMIFKLYSDQCPKTAENFRCLCTGERGTGLTSRLPLHYKGAKFHRVISGFMAQGGDFELGDGRGGESIYGGKFNDEAGGLAIKHTLRGQLSMANSGDSCNLEQSRGMRGQRDGHVDRVALSIATDATLTLFHSLLLVPSSPSSICSPVARW